MKTEVQKNESPQDLTGFLQSLIDSKKLPSHIKTVQDAFTIQQMGKELGFPTMQAFHYIIPIQGRLSLSAKAIGALLRKGGVTFRTIKDGLYVYKSGEELYTRKPTPNKEDEKPIDQITTIEFTRGGVTEEVTFTWMDATKQGLVTKDNWIRMPREMLYARCLAKGANRVAADLLLGLYMTEEMTDSLNVSEKNLVRDEDGAVKELTEDADHEELK
jgi:hypothetical protein